MLQWHEDVCSPTVSQKKKEKEKKSNNKNNKNQLLMPTTEWAETVCSRPSQILA